MLINQGEYQRMFEIEEQFWWYRTLHDKVIQTISDKFQLEKNIRILDAGCGTGGLMEKLKSNGYHNIKGFDYSPHAVALCKERNLDVAHGNLLKLNEEINEVFDVIVCNDVLCQFDDETISQAMRSLGAKIKTGGLLISNNQAFSFLNGTHDLAVGAKKRFTKDDFEIYIQNAPLNIQNFNYWSVIMFFPIFAIRLWQRIKLKLGLVDMSKLKSDVALPASWLNNLLYTIVKLEYSILPKKLWGSSVFLVFDKK